MRVGFVVVKIAFGSLDVASEICGAADEFLKIGW